MTSITHETNFPVEPLEGLYWAEGSKDQMTGRAVGQLVSSLIDFGVSPEDIKFHLQDATKKVES